jgi:hypothetical protein
MTWQLNNGLIMSKISITHVIPQVLIMHPMVHTQNLNPLLPNNPSIEVPKCFNPKTWLERITPKPFTIVSTFKNYSFEFYFHQIYEIFGYTSILWSHQNLSHTKKLKF